jgi:hypothetical protein
MRNISIVVFLILITGTFVFSLSRKPSNPQEGATVPLPTPTLQPTDFTASFEIYTLGTKRIFTDTKYHNLSGEVYISPPDPSIINVKKEDITWADFFATLPMKLEKDCLTTGTGQTFCTNNTRELKFFINEKEDPDALDKEISMNDNFKVVYE